MAYITLANAQRIIYTSDLRALELKGELYKRPIYFFSKYEENSLLAIQELLKDPDKYFTEIYKPIQIVDTYSYVYEGKKPSYHTILSCPRLSSDYKNFEIPNEIKEKGIEQVIEFRKWFELHKHQLSQPDLFVTNLFFRWGIQTNPKALEHTNSGHTMVENYELQDIEVKIDSLIKSAGVFYYSSEKNKEILKRFSKYTFLAFKDDTLKNNSTPYSDNEVKEFLKEYYETYKKPLKQLLVEYYRLKLNPEIKLEGNLLDQLGFCPCGHCYKDVDSFSDILNVDNLKIDDLPF